jgi:phage terminase large subunit
VKNPAKIKVTNVFLRNAEATTRFVVNEGGTGSSKTYSIAQVFLKLMEENKKKPTTFSVVRKTLPSLRATAMKDFLDILKSFGLYEESQHNKSDHIYKIGQSEVAFFSTDDSQKMRGRKHDYVWCNEANELMKEDFVQLNIRTSRQMFIDYNPSDMDSWIYTLDPANTTHIRSTYKDNPFLEASKIREIEAFQNTSEWHWKVYGLGERAISKQTIYTNWELCDRLPDSGSVFYGLDFGFSHETALVRVKEHDGHLYEQELIYEPGLTNTKLIERMKELLPLDAEIHADCEDPNRIEEIANAGFRAIVPCVKGKDSVSFGIDLIQRRKVHILASSVNLIKEKKAYQWRTDRNGTIIEGQPVKAHDHLMDAERYACGGHFADQDKFEVVFSA